MLSLDDARRASCTPARSPRPSAPACGSGYLVGPAALIAEIAKRATNLYISPGMVAQAIVHQFCVSGDIDRSIATVSAALERAGHACWPRRCASTSPASRFTEPDGGYFLWVELPDDVDVDKLLPAAAERGVAVVKGSDFLLEGGQHSLRLAYSARHRRPGRRGRPPAGRGDRRRTRLIGDDFRRWYLSVR